MKHWFDPGSERCEGCGAYPMCPNDVIEQIADAILKWDLSDEAAVRAAIAEVLKNTLKGPDLC